MSDWPLLNALLNTAGGATWVSIHHGGGVGMGYSQHAGVVIVCDGTEAAGRRMKRVLWNDPGTGVMRHADAGYPIAIDCAREQGLDLPMIAGPNKVGRTLVTEAVELRAGHLTLAAPAADFPRSRGAVARPGRPRPHRRRGGSGRQDRRRPAMPLTASTPASVCWHKPAFRTISSRCCRETSCCRMRPGVGEPLSDPVVRLILALKVNALARGYSGISAKLIEALLALLRHEVYPLIPAQGSVGASGDLAPLAHLSRGAPRHRPGACRR